MLYAVGTKIDLRYMNKVQEKPAPDAARKPTLYPAGTTLSFIKMASGMVVTKITEPSLALRVTVSA